MGLDTAEIKKWLGIGNNEKAATTDSTVDGDDAAILAFIKEQKMSLESLKTLATEAEAGRLFTTVLREQAHKISVVALGDKADDSVKKMIDAANLETLQVLTRQYTAIAEEKGYMKTDRITEPVPTIKGELTDREQLLSEAEEELTSLTGLYSL